MRALIVKTSSLGDVLHTFGVVEYLKRQGVETVGWAVEKKAAPLIHAHPNVDTVIEIDSASLRSLFPRPSFVREFFRQRLEAFLFVDDVSRIAAAGLAESFDRPLFV